MPVDTPDSVQAGGPGRHVLGPPRAGILGQRDGDDRRATGDARQQVLACGLVIECQEKLRGHHAGGKERRYGQRPAHLLKGQAELEEAEAAATVLLGDRESVQAELGRHQLP
jgi:hypothetical protein